MSQSLKKKITSGSITIGGWIMIGHPAIAEIMGRSGLDWVAIDLEHSATDISTAENLIRAAQYGGAPALVRLTNNDPNLIKRVLDSGAKGIIVPMVETAEHAREAVKAAFYPPRGTRGVGLARAQTYGPGFQDYNDTHNEETVCIVQIEHISAVINFESIMQVEGVDGYMLGPYDLSASMGLAGQLDHPDVLAAIAEVRQKALKMNKPGGLHIVEPDHAKLKTAIEQGFTFLAYSIDTRIIDTVCRTGVALAKGERNQ